MKERKKERKNERKRLDDLRFAENQLLLCSRINVGLRLCAGHETTSTVLGWCLYALGRYQDIQERVFNDVKRVMGDRIQVEWSVTFVLLKNALNLLT